MGGRWKAPCQSSGRAEKKASEGEGGRTAFPGEGAAVVGCQPRSPSRGHLQRRGGGKAGAVLHHRPFLLLVTCPPLPTQAPSGDGARDGGRPVWRAPGARSVPPAARTCPEVSVMGAMCGGVSLSAPRRTGELPQAEGRSVVSAPTAARGAGEGRLRASCTVSGGGAAPQRAEVGWRSVPAGEGSGRLPAVSLWCSGAGGSAGERPLPPPHRRAAFVLPPHLSAGLGGTAQVGAGTAAAAAHPRSRGGEVRRGCAVLRRPLPGLRGAAARRGLRLRPAAGAAGTARPLLGFSRSRFPFRPAARREMQQRQPGPSGKDGARRWASGISPAGARWGCRARGRSRVEQLAGLPCRSRGVRAAARGALGRPQPGSSGAARTPGTPAGPGHGGGGHKPWAFPPFSPATERRDTRSRCWCMHLADLAWEVLRDWGEAAFEPAQPVINYRLQLKF